MKYCFFDIDGVLNKSSDWVRPFTYDKELVKIFCQFVNDEKLTPVITSSWKSGFISSGNKKNAAYMISLEKEFEKYGVLIYAAIPDPPGKSRDECIKYFIRRNPCKDYIIIDDDPSEYIQLNKKNYFTDFHTGITTSDCKKMKKLLIR